MSNIMISGGEAETMSSREIADLLEARHDSVKRTIERLADRGLASFTPSVETSHDGAGARPVEVYLVGKRDSYVVVAQLSPEFTARLVDYWQEHSSQRPMSPAEMFLHNAQAMVAIEREQGKQAQAIASISATVARVEAAQTVWPARPSNAEGITHIRARIGKLHGLSSSIVDAVMRQTPYTPKPAGIVRNDHADAAGAPFTVYWQKVITMTFARFVDECEQVTPTMFTHPLIEGRFRFSSRSVVGQ